MPAPEPRRDRRGRAAARPRGELSLVCASPPWLLALPAIRVERLLLPDEVVLGPADAGGARLLTAGDRRFALWDLGALFGTGRSSGAYIGLRLAFRGHDLTLALGVDRCLAVQPLPITAGLPPALFRARAGAFIGAFAAATAAARVSLGPVGIALDPAQLWTVEELESSTRVLEGSGSAG